MAATSRTYSGNVFTPRSLVIDNLWQQSWTMRKLAVYHLCCVFAMSIVGYYLILHEFVVHKNESKARSDKEDLNGNKADLGIRTTKMLSETVKVSSGSDMENRSQVVIHDLPQGHNVVASIISSAVTHEYSMSKSSNETLTNLPQSIQGESSLDGDRLTQTESGLTDGGENPGNTTLEQSIEAEERLKRMEIEEFGGKSNHTHQDISSSGKNQDYHVIYITNGTGGLENSESESDFSECKNLEPHMKCVYSPDSYSLWNRSDAVIFRAFHVRQNLDLWQYRPPGQKWIFDEHESPMKTWNLFRLKKVDIWDKFNITIVYTEDADIQNYMYGFKCWKKEPLHKRVRKNYLVGKVGSVLWMASNCKWTMGRELYVEELKKYIDVDIVGECGNRTECGLYGDLDVACTNALINRYKFYLSFENSFCEGYYTEKIRKTVETRTIPIVMGLMDYSKLLPRDSYINVRDFSSPKELAAFLHSVGNDKKLYNRYLQSKAHLQCARAFPKSYMCDLCRYLHENKGRVQVKPDMREFWGKSSRCQSPDNFFKGVADEIIPKLRQGTLFYDSWR